MALCRGLATRPAPKPERTRGASEEERRAHETALNRERSRTLYASRLAAGLTTRGTPRQRAYRPRPEAMKS